MSPLFFLGRAGVKMCGMTGVFVDPATNEPSQSQRIGTMIAVVVPTVGVGDPFQKTRVVSSELGFLGLLLFRRLKLI